MKEILLGWLLKGRCEVSALDGIIFFAEIAIVIFSICIPLGMLEVRRKRFRK